MNRLPVLIVGGSGVFGSRLAMSLVVAKRYRILLGGRSREKASEIAKKILAIDPECGASFFMIDRTRPDIERLRALAPKVIVDAAGPFQDSTLVLAEAAIAIGAHYIDLADARRFVGSMGILDETAKRAGVAVLSGASSTPALSHAVLDEITKGWKRIDRILVAISPGNRAPRGRSVVAAILSYAGQKIRVFRDAGWEEGQGWGANEKIDLPGIGRRNAVLCETPDLDLLVSRYHPRVAAEFKAGLELGLLHHGLRFLSWLVRRGMLRSLVPLAGLLHGIASLLKPFGSDKGGMLVEATGQDGEGRALKATWTLSAAAGQGPDIPALPAMCLIERIGNGRLDFIGADAAAGHVSLSEIMSHLNRLRIDTDVKRYVYKPPQLFEAAMGPLHELLPATTRAIHRPEPALVLTGLAYATGAENAAGRLVARAFGFPPGGEGVPVRVVIERRDDHERWARVYPERTMRSHMSTPDPARGTIEERFGAFRFRLKITGRKDGLNLDPVHAAWGGIPLPRLFLPQVRATERVSPEGRHLFDVAISLWPFGRLVHYKGWLSPPA